MPLQNRVDPFGELFADPSRGTLMGNRGGRFHTQTRTLTARRWASRQWICCVLTFRGRHRDVWGRFYTELFFLDEPTALAAGHRPCFECRRQDAEAFAEAWRKAKRLPVRPYADEMDLVLHERITIRDGAVEQSNFHDYNVMRMSDLPEELNVKFVDVDTRPTGLGEIGNPFIAGAISNAFYRLTGKRLRHLPFTPERVLETLKA